MPTPAPPDLAGELLFIRDSIDGFRVLATSTGARVIHCCGFDSVPSDLGVLLLRQAALAEDAGELEDNTLVVTAFKGGFSGGKLATMKVQQAEVSASPSLSASSRIRTSSAQTAELNRSSVTNATSGGSSTTPNSTSGSARSSWRVRTSASCAAATLCRTGLTAVASDTGK